MASRNGNLQHNAAFALYGLADNEDNIAAIVREGGVRTLQDCEQSVQVPFPSSSMHLRVAQRKVCGVSVAPTAGFSISRWLVY